MNNSERAAYTRYLTERLDSGQSQNVVIPTVANLIIQKTEKNESVRVLDIGCFSGAMLNRIRSEVPDTIRSGVEFVGVDMDEEALNLGRGRYQGISFVSGEVNVGFEEVGTFDIVILSNILHEAIPEDGKTDQETEVAVSAVLGTVTKLLNPDGNLVILDGLRPENDQSLVVVKFADDSSNSLYKVFADRYQAFPIQATELPGGGFQTRMKDLAAFLTKARYLDKGYWNVESKQKYQYFTASQFISTLQTCGLEVKRLEPQVFDQKHLQHIVAEIQPETEMPAKNVLIVAQKMT